MPDLSGFPYVEAQLDRDGELSPPGQGAAVVEAVHGAQLTDLIVIAHGWNNDMADARALYAAIFKQVQAVLPRALLGADRRLGVLGVLWPSKKFTERELVPGGGAASFGDEPDDATDVSTAQLEQQIDRLGEVANPGAPNLDELKLLAERLEDDPAARERFVVLVRASLDPPAQATGVSTPAYEASPDALDTDPEQLFEFLRAPVIDRPGQSDSGGAAGLGDASPQGGAANIGSIFTSAKAAAERLLNFATYYQMKERAGRVGSAGVADLLRTVRRSFPQLKIHLVGHSFGARLVTAAADTCGTEVKPASLLLLQAAFSHNGFAPSFQAEGESRVGFFRRVVEDGKVAGPIVITHTANDKAVGLAYAIASRLARQAAAELGDEDDLYGGLGRNGAVRTPEAQPGGQALELLAPGADYPFAPGRIFNLKADRFIDGHSGICNDAVAYALLKAIA